MAFDYEKAWRIWAVPEFSIMSEKVKDLYSRTLTEAGALSQNADLSMPWPDENFKKAFEDIDTEELAKSSRIVYFFGHWAPGAPSDEFGVYWKYARYADQSILDRDKFRNIKRDRGFGLELHQGIIRLTHSSKNSWTQKELGIPRKTEFDALAVYVNRIANMKELPTFEEAFEVAMGFMGDQSWFCKFEAIIEACGGTV